MNVEELRLYCLSKVSVTECTPFDDVTLVFKVAGKMFALIPLDEMELSVALKCDPELAVQLREQYPAVQPGWHMNKTHWNTVKVDGSLSNRQITEMVDHSYDLVVKSLNKKQRELLENSLKKTVSRK
ncbi:MAG TPA: MmcQ/YjbR family DNA-binding protein [Bacteroidales bacterium]|nr:MmcQ/YjbR family DNA-binding protein [Bacteroidales bacterium]HRW95952.1 MmcQ/YjbR family DNA-binding protein [Bacteroidales bacterium]